jgi:hypothetical protein
VEAYENFKLAEPIPGKTTDELSLIAKELGIVIIASLFEKRAEGLYHNTTAVLDADGEPVALPLLQSVRDELPVAVADDEPDAVEEAVAEAVPEAPPVATVFAEDMPAIEVAAMGTDNPGGLSNLGNTCYLNSTLQCMKAIPEFSSSLKLYNGAGVPAEDSFVMAMRAIISELERSNSAREVQPLGFVRTFHDAFPMFAQRTPDGHPMQQDAEECWSTIVNALSQRMQLAVDGTNPRIAPTATVPVLPRMTALKRNLGDMLFGIELESSYKCLEGDEAYTKREKKLSIPCHISEKTAHLYTALDVNQTLLEVRVERREELFRCFPLLVWSNEHREVFRHVAGFDRLDDNLFECLRESDERRVSIEFSAVLQSSRPRID